MGLKKLITEKISKEITKQAKEKFRKIFFISDTHFDDDRLNLFGRDLIFKNKQEVDDYIIQKWNEVVTNEDLVIHVGDIALSREGLDKINLLNGTKWLVKGNYDTSDGTAKFKVTDELLKKYFKVVVSEMSMEIGGETIYINHYPVNAKTEGFNIVGHIHGLFKVQRNMINVGVDANHFVPLSEEYIKFQMNGIRKYYDQNVFAGELKTNLMQRYGNIEVLRAPEYSKIGDFDMNKSYVFFLAGPIQGAPQWQEELIKKIQKKHEETKIKCNFIIASPRRLEKSSDFNYFEQVTWESFYLKRASEYGAIIFWLPLAKEQQKGRSYAQTTRFEIGEWWGKKQQNNKINIIVGGNKSFDGLRYVEHKFNEIDKDFKIKNKLDDIVDEIFKKIIKQVPK